MKALKTRVYLLSDAETDTPMYVGVTRQKKLRCRLESHTSGGTKATCHWIRELKQKKRSFTVKILEVCEPRRAQAIERFWIAYYLKQNPNLLNIKRDGYLRNSPLPLGR